VDAGDAPGVSSGDGVDDDARERMSKTMVSTSCLYASWGDEEWRLEWQCASAMIGGGDLR
jgi:hypothetical protein